MEVLQGSSSVSRLRRCALSLVGIAMLLHAPGVHAGQEGVGVPASHNREIVSKAFAAWAAGGKTFFDDVLAPDVIWTIKGSGPSAGVHRGRQALIERAVTPLSSRLAGPISPTVRNLWAEGEHVVIHWDGEATTKEGKPYRNSYVWIFHMQDGRATEVTAFLDLVAYDRVVQPGRRLP